MNALHAFLAALVTFTRIPVPLTLDANAFRKASLQLPLLGWLIGGLQWLLLSVASQWISPDPALFLALAFPILLSGGMHEDGLADFADGMFGGQTVESRLAIMKDPRVGSFGVLALILVLAGNFIFLQSTESQFRGPLLLVTAVMSRGLCVGLLSVLPYKNHAGSRSQSFLPEPSSTWKALIPLWPLLPALLVLPTKFDRIAFASVLLFLFITFKIYLRKNLGGVTGDCLGAAIQLTSCCLYLTGCCLWPLA